MPYAITNFFMLYFASQKLVTGHPGYLKMASGGEDLFEAFKNEPYDDVVLKPEARKYAKELKKISESSKLSLEEIKHRDFYRFLAPVPEVYNETTNRIDDNLFNIFGKNSNPHQSADEIREMMLFYSCMQQKYFEKIGSNYLSTKGLKLKDWTGYMQKNTQRGDELAVFVLSVQGDQQTVIFHKNGFWSTLRDSENKSTEFIIRRCQKHLVYVGRSFFLQLAPRNTPLPATKPVKVELERVDVTHPLDYLTAVHCKPFEICVKKKDKDLAEIAKSATFYKIPEENISEEMEIDLSGMLRVPRVDGKMYCPEEGCTRSYVKKQDLNRHYLSHKEPDISCDQCDYSTSDKRLMKQHKNIHQKEMLFQCAKCNKKFRHAMQLYRHQKAKGSKCER